MSTSSKAKKAPVKSAAKTGKASDTELLSIQDEAVVPNDVTPQQSPLQELFLDGIKDIFWAENHLVKALPKMQKAAASQQLADAIGNHLAVTKNQVTRLEKVFELLGEKVQAKKCDAMEGLTKEGEGIIEDTPEGTSARDIGIILASQKVEMYEASAYSGLSKLALSLGYTDISALLAETLAEEQESDALLGSLADEISNSGTEQL